jgi:hypothetical protein
MDDYDTDKVDETVLALLHLTTFEDHGVVRAEIGNGLRLPSRVTG